MECGAFSQDSILFPGMCCFIDFIDIACTVRNSARRTKLISSVFKKIYRELIISKITKFLFGSTTFHGIFRNGNPFILGYSPDIEQSTISCFHASNIISS